MQRDTKLVKTLDIQSAFTNRRNISLSDIASDIEYVQLETNDNSLIGSIGKVILFNQTFIIYDQQTERILMFDNKGKFLRQIGSKGKGPGEFLQVSDFTVAECDSTICILDDMQQRFLKYGTNGKLVYGKTLESNPDKLSFLDEALIVQYNFPDFVPNQQYSLSIYDQNMQVSHRLLNHASEKITANVANIMASHSRSFFNYVNDTLTFWECRYDTIYQITKGNEIKRKYYLQYSNKPSPINGFNYDKMSDINEIDWLRETTQYLFIKSTYKSDYLSIIFFKDADVGVSLKDGSFINDIDSGILFFPEGVAASDVLYKTFSVFEMKTEWEKNKRKIPDSLQKIFDNTQYLDNPCLMLVTLKYSTDRKLSSNMFRKIQPILNQPAEISCWKIIPFQND
ncbi:hypothetical protein FACS189430_00660 [Bacteroidia bacterium]|nr:hypothetical protein FACS189430_00660 [Bacteroidia bacterium]